MNDGRWVKDDELQCATFSTTMLLSFLFFSIPSRKRESVVHRYLALTFEIFFCFQVNPRNKMDPNLWYKDKFHPHNVCTWQNCYWAPKIITSYKVANLIDDSDKFYFSSDN